MPTAGTTMLRQDRKKQSSHPYDGWSFDRPKMIINFNKSITLSGYARAVLAVINLGSLDTTQNKLGIFSNQNVI